MTASNRKIDGDFRISARADSAEIIPLHRSVPNEALRLQQYKIQKRMLDEAIAANEAVAITPEMLAVRQQPVREYSQTYIDQAKMQGEKGWAFKI
jgi:hypothetical protein